MNTSRWKLRVGGTAPIEEVGACLERVGLGMDGPVEFAAQGWSVPVCGGARAAFWPMVRDRGWDVALAREELRREQSGVIAFDCDSTLVLGEGIDELAARAGVQDRVAAITDRAMAGELDYAESLRQRVQLLAGLAEADLRAVATAIRLRPGSRECVAAFLQAGWRVMVVSGGFEFYLAEVQRRLEVDRVVGNRLRLERGVVTGEVEGSIVGAHEKAGALESFLRAVPAHDSIAVGDGANDRAMMRAAVTAVGVVSRPTLDAEIDVQLGSGGLAALPWLCGLPRNDANSSRD